MFLDERVVQGEKFMPGTKVEIILDSWPLALVEVDESGCFQYELNPCEMSNPRFAERQKHFVEAWGTKIDGLFGTTKLVGFFMMPECNAMIVSPQHGSATCNPKISAITPPNANTTLYVNGIPEQHTLSDEYGFAYFTLEVEDNEYAVSITAIDTAGMEHVSETVIFTLDTTRPAVEILNPAQGAVVVSGLLVIRGECEPGAIVTVYIEGDGETIMRDVEVDANGFFEIVINEALKKGQYTLTPSAMDRAGLNFAGDSQEFSVVK